MFSLKAFADHLLQMRRYFAFSAILFFAGVIVGGTNSAFEGYLDSQLQGIGEIAGMINNASNPTLFMLVFIFLNNTIKSVLVIYLGAAFGVAPLLFLLLNGMILGYLFTSMEETGQNAAAMFLKGIVPHGIIEIPAILIACAYGLKFGMLSLRAVGSLISRDKGIGKEYEFFAVRTVPVIVFLAVALLAAAVIESTVTVWLLSL
ncbi:membrane protein [Paenibacillus darwinianus]|uniref:Membrane protein n=1 Tax=Paenibacillus darwinianus TaxID=1380763 RepID=A0A9W5S1I1_9BACL|nr:stage II sporulation protein M [Paenibacillus darwinianus]EXX88924.1 membrane protein [Paenibacillus darwinianus]EXX89606.1 membrane protein [Paenibacillus darwinianus]EXX90255.1 membrane protein [Paenibacillus darwinianus]